MKMSPKKNVHKRASGPWGFTEEFYQTVEEQSPNATYIVSENRKYNFQVSYEANITSINT